MAEIGESLREARMRARIDISEVETRTKIRAKYLRALENEEWNLLPGPVYVKSFLKTYGDYLGLDSRLLIDEFKRRYERPSENEVRASATSVRDRERDRKPPNRVAGTLFSPIGVIVVALVVIVVALYLIGSHGSNNNSALTGTITPSNGAKTPSRKQGSGSHKQSKSTTSSTRSKTTTTHTATTHTTTTALAKVATLSMVPTGTTWVCVENGAGTTLYTGDYSTGDKLPKETSSAILVVLGNSEMTVTANGKPYTPSGGSPIGFKVTPKGVTSLTTLPSC